MGTDSTEGTASIKPRELSCRAPGFSFSAKSLIDISFRWTYNKGEKMKRGRCHELPRLRSGNRLAPAQTAAPIMPARPMTPMSKPIVPPRKRSNPSRGRTLVRELAASPAFLTAVILFTVNAAIGVFSAIQSPGRVGSLSSQLSDAMSISTVSSQSCPARRDGKRRLHVCSCTCLHRRRSCGAANADFGHRENHPVCTVEPEPVRIPCRLWRLYCSIPEFEIIPEPAV